MLACDTLCLRRRGGARIDSRNYSTTSVDRWNGCEIGCFAFLIVFPGVESKRGKGGTNGGCAIALDPVRCERAHVRAFWWTGNRMKGGREQTGLKQNKQREN